MSTTSTEILSGLYQSLYDWIPVKQFCDMIDAYFDSDRPEKEVQDYRVARGGNALKKLRTELVPLYVYLKATKADGHVRFPDRDPPDFLFRARGVTEQGIEVTRAGARAEIQINLTLNSVGEAAGFLGLPDASPEAHFAAARKRGRVMYSTAELVQATRRNIQDALERKNAPQKYGGLNLDLVIDVDRHHLDDNAMYQLATELTEPAASLPFNRIFVVAGKRGQPFSMCIKP